MKLSRLLLIGLSSFFLFTGCESPVSSLDDNSDSNNDSSTPKEYSCKIEKIVVSSLNTADWDAFGGYGDPKYVINFNGSHFTSTSAKSDMAPHLFPATYTIEKTIANPFDGQLEVKLIDEDVSENDQRLDVIVDLNDYKNRSSASFSYSGFDYSATMYITWIEK